MYRLIIAWVSSRPRWRSVSSITRREKKGFVPLNNNRGREYWAGTSEERGVNSSVDPRRSSATCREAPFVRKSSEKNKQRGYGQKVEGPVIHFSYRIVVVSRTKKRVWGGSMRNCSRGRVSWGEAHCHVNKLELFRWNSVNIRNNKSNPRINRS